MTLYYAETGIGACLREAKDEESARRQILREVGSYAGVRFVRKATEKDIAWVRAMSGDPLKEERA